MKTEETIKTKCPTCNASISFNPKLGKWKCEYCGSTFSLEEVQANNKSKSNNVESVKNENVNIKEDNFTDYVSYRCESCGAEIIADEETSATFCVYCGNTAILKSKLSGNFKPNKIIPFKTEKNQAIEAFKNLSHGRPLMPKDFNNASNIEKIKGVYIPFWLYDITVQGKLNILGEKKDNWVVGDTHYTKTSKYDVVRGGTMDFSNIPIDGSTRFDNDIMNTLEPFDYKEMVPYNHEYLSGFYAEKYDCEGEEIFNEVSERALNSAQEVLLGDTHGYTSTVIKGNTLDAKETKKEYALLPVWMVNVKYKEKIYIFAMNGQTGEFIGNIPLDKAKATIYSIIIFIIMFLLAILVDYLVYKNGG